MSLYEMGLLVNCNDILKQKNSLNKLYFEVSQVCNLPQLYVNGFVFRYKVRQDAVYPHLLVKAGLRIQ